jgi:hypothetical protein
VQLRRAVFAERDAARGSGITGCESGLVETGWGGPVAAEEKYYCLGVGVALIVDVKSQVAKS